MGLVQGRQAAPQLTPYGVRQADRCARLLASEPVGLIVSSDLPRAVQTSLPIARELHMVVRQEPRLRERSLGTAEGKRTSLLAPDGSGIAEGRVVDAGAAPSGGEPVRDLYHRACSCLAELLEENIDGDIVVVCHGGVVRVALAWLDGVGPEDMAWPEVANGMIVGRTVPAPTLSTSSSTDCRPPNSLGTNNGRAAQHATFTKKGNAK